MRIMPRSARATWLLAAAAWVGGCAIGWWLLPPQPRAVADISGPTNKPGDYKLGDVAPGGRSVTLFGRPDKADGGALVRLWNTVNGSIRTLVSDHHSLDVFERSPDGRWIVVGTTTEELDGARRLHIVNLDTGDEDEWKGTAGAMIWFQLARFSPDSRWLAIEENPKVRKPGAVRVWNLLARRPGPLLATAAGPVAFSPDGLRIGARIWPGAESKNSVEEMGVWDTDTGRKVGHISLPFGEPISRTIVALTPDGTGLIVKVESTDVLARVNPLERSRDQYSCINVADGRERWSVADVLKFNIIEDGRRLVVHRHNLATDTGAIYVLDANSGEEISRLRIGGRGSLAQAGPDGRTLLLYTSGLSDDDHSEVLEAATGRRMHIYPHAGVYAPDGRSLVTVNDGGAIELWDIPPRKSLGWFALAAAILALPFAGLAWRRSRRLSRGVA
jgi:WD40 repeat protein